MAEVAFRPSIQYAVGGQLAQTRPSGTSAVSAYTARLQTEISLIVICNTTGGAIAASLYCDDDGSTFDQTTAIYYGRSIPANDSLLIKSNGPGGVLVLSPGGQIGVQTASANALTFTIYGSTGEVTGGREDVADEIGVVGWVSAVVAVYDEEGEPDGYGPAVPGVFQARADLSDGDMWRVTSVSVANVTVTALPGGDYTVTAGGGVTPGTYSFDWELDGPSPTTGSQNFDVT